MQKKISSWKNTAKTCVDLVTHIQHSNGLEITAKLQSPDLRRVLLNWHGTADN